MFEKIACLINNSVAEIGVILTDWDVMSAQRRSSSRNGRRTSTGTPKSPASGGLTYPTIRQRGYYSDILGGGSKDELRVSLKIQGNLREWYMCIINHGGILKPSVRYEAEKFILFFIYIENNLVHLCCKCFSYLSLLHFYLLHFQCGNKWCKLPYSLWIKLHVI